MRRVLAVVLFLVVSSSANATLITIDPDDYAHGTDLTHVGEGLTLRALWQVNTYSDPVTNRFYAPLVRPVIAANCDYLCGDLDGDREFGAVGPSGAILASFGPIDWYSLCVRGTESGLGGSVYCRDGFEVLEMLFDSPTDFLQLDTAWGSDASSIMAYNSAGQLLFSCTAPHGVGCPGTQIVTSGIGNHSSTFIIERETNDIARVIFGGMMGGASIGGITYSVPEPGTLALLWMGLLGVSLSRRRKV